MATAPADPEQFEATGAAGNVLRGEEMGEGIPTVLLHGLTATRRHVVHGSKHLPRKGHRLVSYDARGHGESDPGPSYAYADLAADLGTLLDQVAPGRAVVLVGHSMGTHTATRFALDHPDRVAALVAAGPATLGGEPKPEALEYWRGLAEGLERGGIEGFIEAYDRNLVPEWREVILRLARERLALHRDLGAIAQALRETPASAPFSGPEELERLDVPALVVGSHDDSDPEHPYAVAAEWAERLPQGRLVTEEKGQSPLAWSGGKLSREIEAFCQKPAVARRLTG